MNKYGPKAAKEIKKTMREFKHGDLHSSSGDKVTDRDQAVAIGISKARAKNYKTPKPKN